MKTFSFLLVVLVSSTAFASEPIGPVGIDYDPSTALQYPLDAYIATFNQYVGSYNQLVTGLRMTPPHGNPNDLQFERTRTLQAKAKVEAEQARLSSAIAARASVDCPVCGQIPWGSSPSDAAKLLEKRGAKQRDGSSSAELKFDGGEFGGTDVQTWDLKFTGGKLFCVTVIFSSHNEAAEEFRQWNQAIATKYKIADGAKDLGYNFFNVRDGSFKAIAPDVSWQVTMANVAAALEQGSWQPHLLWTFSSGSRIDLALISFDSVALRYTNGQIAAAATAVDQKAKADGQKDF